ncbi:F-box protein CPR30-like [Prunus yedoensis var. nudiflora]|uniref:F-box protein CPR30-like n=1 Tax=Prunus yedoensis var. nudiflora TaxID=2094558 RepID=A0A314ZIX5_PRUYE|nr:F-box protein CPR30-like [Prunus yedoensis var. nudiflora]
MALLLHLGSTRGLITTRWQGWCHSVRISMSLKWRFVAQDLGRGYVIPPSIKSMKWDCVYGICNGVAYWTMETQREYRVSFEAGRQQDISSIAATEVYCRWN